jgi:FkbM family methyltransferase
MKVHSFAHKLILSPIYYILHHNFIFGYLHKIIFKKFTYRNFKFNLNIDNLPLSHRASFLFKTYEYNDRKICEKNLSKKNKCIVIGGGIGFIPTLVYHKTKNDILAFEINKKIIKNLNQNLLLNHCKFKLYNNNLVFDNKNSSTFYHTVNFLETSGYFKTKDKFIVKNINFKKIKNFFNFNTLIIDGEGVEEYYIKNLTKMKNIKYILFELHNNLLAKDKVSKIFKVLNVHNFILADKCFNSYYFKKTK